MRKDTQISRSTTFNLLQQLRIEQLVGQIPSEQTKLYVLHVKFENIAQFPFGIPQRNVTWCIKVLTALCLCICVHSYICDGDGGDLNIIFFFVSQGICLRASVHFYE